MSQILQKERKAIESSLIGNEKELNLYKFNLSINRKKHLET
jgi:hypothetical protein